MCWRGLPSTTSFVLTRQGLAGSEKCNFLLCCRCCQALLRLFLPCILWALCHLAPSSLAASLGVGTFVSNDLLSVRVQAPVTRCSLRLSTPVGRPRGGDPIYTTACVAGPEIARAASTSTKA